MPPPPQPVTFSSDFRRFFGRGLAVLLPSILTLWLLWTAFVFVFNNVAAPINRGIRVAVLEVVPYIVPRDRLFIPRATEEEQAAGTPERAVRWYQVTEWERDALMATRPALRNAPARADREIRAAKFRQFWDAHWYLSASGLIVAIALIYLAGMLLGGLIGRRMYARLEALISKIPGFKQVYPHVKQLVDLIIGDKPMAFKRVVLVQYPRQGIWTLGLVTSNSLAIASDAAQGGCVAIFIPSTPTPFTGFTITVPERDVIDVPISIDEAIRFVLTGGVLIPERQQVPPVEPVEAELQRRIAGTLAGAGAVSGGETTTGGEGGGAAKLGAGGGAGGGAGNAPGAGT
jgi:uncharacterized membrane protein